MCYEASWRSRSSLSSGCQEGEPGSKGRCTPGRHHSVVRLQLSRVPIAWRPIFEFGAGGRARTDDLTITNRLRYQLRHTGRYQLEPIG